MSNIKERGPEEVAFNATIGRNIKYLRKIRNLNQTKVANAVLVKFQQLQKYEKGVNGVSSYRLNLLAKFFKVGVDVLIDPKMITSHKGFTGNMDWLDHQIEIDKELDRQGKVDVSDSFIEEPRARKCP
tara:strand:- start:877 stop:1260 length:384 start_codon:yes stop_codon:yes gene_type:complete